MNRNDPNDRNDPKMLNRDLRDFPTPPPPAGLLQKIQAEIPDGAALAGAATTDSAGPSRWPLRIAATLVLAVLGGTVAFQVVKKNQQTEFNRQAAEFEAGPAPQGADSPHDLTSPPPPPTSPKAELRKSAAGETVTSPSPESFPVKEGTRPSELAQPVEVPEAVQDVGAYDSALSVGGKDKAEEVSGVERGVAGGVVGGVPGGVAGGSIAGSYSPPASPAAPKPNVQGYLADRSAKQAAASASSDRAAEAPLRRVDRDEERSRESETVRERDRSDDLALRAQPDTMIFRETPANRFEETAEDRLSTFALDVDTGSYTLTRGYLDRGTLPPPAAIRVEEFVNAQKYDDPAPSTRNRGSDFALYAEGAPAQFYPGGRTRLLRFSVKAREIDAQERKSAVLTFVVDVSGSMNQENRLGLVKRALGLLLNELRPDDRVGLVVYGTNGRILLRHTRDLEEIRRAISELEPEGSTNVEEGLRLAYDLADEGWRSGAINRIILCSDGVANVGATGPESILARIGTEAQRGIALTTVGFGMGNYNDTLMEQLADQGDGTYHYVDALAEARKVFVDNLTGTLETVAREAKAQVEFDPESVVRWRLLGYENRDVADRDFRNDRIDAGELGSGHQATALYEVRLRDGVSGGDRIATLRLRWKSVAAKQVVEESRELRARDLDRDWEDASANFHHAALAAAFAERLKETPEGSEVGWRTLAREAGRLESERSRNASARDLADSIARAARIAHAGVDDRRSFDEERPERNRRLDEE